MQLFHWLEVLEMHKIGQKVFFWFVFLSTETFVIFFFQKFWFVKFRIFAKNYKIWQFSWWVVNTLTAKTSSSTWPINIPDIDFLPPTRDESSVFFTLREEREMTQLRIQVLQAWKRCLKVTGNVFKNDPPALTIGKPQIPRFTVVPRCGTATRCVLERI